MEQTQAAAIRLADQAEQRILSLWGQHEVGDITLVRFRALAASVIAQLNTSGVQLADLGVTLEVSRQLRRIRQPLGLRPSPVAVDQDRIGSTLESLATEELGGPPEEVATKRRSRLGALARSEPLLTTATAVQAAMSRREATGWVRQTDADPCRSCAGWADGVVRPTGTRMKRHPGCGCIQVPVFLESSS